MWESWHEPYAYASQDQEDRVGNPYHSGQLREHGHDAKEPDQILQPKL